MVLFSPRYYGFPKEHFGLFYSSQELVLSYVAMHLTSHQEECLPTHHDLSTQTVAYIIIISCESHQSYETCAVAKHSYYK